jgi:D-sedoheptulose 7-phosphate isomerase
MQQPESEPAGGVETLYPFLYTGQSDLAAVLQEVRRSTEEKAREIMALRERLGQELAERLSACAHAMADAFVAHGTLFAFGNGGSSTDAQALAQLFLHPPLAAGPDGPRACQRTHAPTQSRQPLPAFALTNDVAVVTALANDVGFDVVFARQIAAFGKPGDIAVGLSTSGNSANVMRAFDEAAQRGLLTVGFAGYQGGAMAEATSIAHLFVVPSSSVHRIQEAQTTLYHMLWECTQAALITRSSDYPSHH